MKKTLLAVVAVLAMTSCSQNEIDGIDNGKQNGKAEIKFGYTPITRATPIEENADFTTFTVNAYDATDINVQGASEVIKNGVFNKNATEWKSDGDKKYYWPASGNVSFFGYNHGTFTKPTEANKAPTLSYTIASNIVDQKDLLVAQQLGTKTNATNGTVTLSFKHALSQVRFKLEGKDNSNLTYTISSIKIYDIKSEGTFDYKDFSTIDWTPSGSNLTEADAYTMDFSLSKKVIQSDTQDGIIDLIDPKEIMILMPQTGTAKIAITYSVTNTEGATIHKDDVATVMDQSITWAAGKKYTYKLSLTPDELKITAGEPETWTEGTI